MKPEQSEVLFIEGLVSESFKKQNLKNQKILNIEKLTGDASTRRYYRIFTNLNSFVVCLGEPFDKKEKSDFLLTHDLLFQKGVRVPFVYDENGVKGYILEEDLGNSTLLSHLSRIACREKELEIYICAVNELIKIHEISCLEEKFSLINNRKFDKDKLFEEFNFTIKFFFKNLIKVNFSKQEERTIYNDFSMICKRLEREPFVLCHRDYHSRNIMLKNDDCVIIDFQDARMGLPQYDLVSLLEDAYYDLGDKNRLLLKDYYWDNFLKKKNIQNRSEFELLYNLSLLQRIFKAIGSFSYIYETRKDKRYLKYIGYSFEKFRHTLMGFKEYKATSVILSKYYYEN